MRNLNLVEGCAVVGGQPVAVRERGDYFVHFMAAWRDQDGKEHNVRVNARGALAKAIRVNLRRGDPVMFTGELQFRDEYFTVRLINIYRLRNELPIEAVGKRLFLVGGWVHWTFHGYAASDTYSMDNQDTVTLLINLEGQRHPRKYAYTLHAFRPIQQGSALIAQGQLAPGVPAHKTHIAPVLAPDILLEGAPVLHHVPESSEGPANEVAASLASHH
ncbi:hypothetical protein [Deinococcus aluminii]|uniref:Uncharacterized protein n=1 Tax=Deinococcus aluminii TaxID=1656885 RepID=A0ABP9XGD3_9DEIO